MSRLAESNPNLFVQVDEEKHKSDAVERKSDGVDDIVIRIKNISDSEEGVRQREKLLQELLRKIEIPLNSELASFYLKYKDILLRQKIEMEDVYNEAIKVMMKFIDKWQTKDIREATGKDWASFLTFFFHKQKGLTSNLVSIFISPALTAKRFGYEVSIDAHKEGGNLSLKGVFVDERAVEGFGFTMKKELMQKLVLGQLYTDNDPFLSLILILKYGLPGMEIWKEKFVNSLKNKKAVRGRTWNRILKNISKFNLFLESYKEGSDMDLDEIGEVLGCSGEAVRQKLEITLSYLKSSLEK